MKSSKALTLLSALAFASAASAVTTDAVGFVSVTVPANSDAILAVPLNRAAEFKGVIQTISGSTITVAGTPAWTASQFVQSLPGQPKTYAVQIASGAKEGLIGRVTANGVNTLTITLDSGEDLTGIGSVDVPVDPDGAGPLAAQSDQLDIMPYWTPASLFTGAQDGTELYYYLSSTGISSTGTFVAPSALFVYDAGSGGWLDQITESSANHIPLNYATAISVRNNSASSYNLSFVGSVPMSKHRVLLPTYAGGVAQDVRIGFSSPVPELLSSVGLPALEGDQLFVYDNTATGKFKAPSQILVYDGSTWLDSVSESPVPTFQLVPGAGYLFRKAATASPSNSLWTKLQSYLAP